MNEMAAGSLSIVCRLSEKRCRRGPSGSSGTILVSSQEEPTTIWCHEGPFHRSLRRLSAGQPRRDILRHTHCFAGLAEVEFAAERNFGGW